ncbi:hypothetical protein B0T10DRAFT_453553 [Thelonectria olida]|uniref:Copper acquisition factor BIM1-like domain-containing protein n=1 Tax=Thelonectria olida TaxID=1576542 RepID=A0A9P8WEU8_9HYPO|nr:hypothetical protein B0T10DRAFT_453553 [Thelonectria olida]
MRTASLLSAAALYSAASAHFVLKYPESIGFSDDDEGTSPCGGFTPDFSGDKVVDFHVGGEAIALRSTHQQANWLFRVTTDQKAKSGWEQIFPIVQQSGLGDFCEPSIVLNSSYVGKKGVVGIVSNAPDGLLYQCIAANFVKGSADAPSECKNASSVKASFTDDSKLSALVSDSGSDSSSSSSGTETAASSTSSATESAASSTNSDNAAPGLKLSWSVNGLGSMAVTVVSMVVVGGALMI